jgi:hypothetical protein
MVNEAEREVAYRRRVYPRWVDQGKVSADAADYHLRVMEAIARRLASDAAHK